MSGPNRYLELPPDEVYQGLLWATAKTICRILTTLLFDYRAYGLENIPRHGGVLLCCNHQSLLDPILIGVRLRRAVNFIAKVELFRNRFSSWFLGQMHVFAVRRGEGDVGAVKEAIRRLQEGRILVMFPEGTRCTDGRIGPIQPGIGMLVRRAEVAVVPAVVDGAFEAWPRSSKLFRPGRIRVMFGPPIKIDGLKGREIVALLQSTLERMQRELKERVTRE